MFTKISIKPDRIEPGDIIDTQDGLGHWFEVAWVGPLDDLIVVFPHQNDTPNSAISFKSTDEVFVLREP